MVRRTLKFILKSLFLGIMLLSIYFSYCNHHYQQMKKEKPIESIVLSIQNQEDFIKIDEVSDEFIKSLVATEDRRFYNRSGFDFRALFRAILTNIETGQLVQGGSTIPQQVGKLLYFDHVQTLEEKVIQVFIMYDLESLYSKDEILELYINSIYFGSGYTGIKEASLGYFHSNPLDLDYPKASLLAGIIPAPSVYDPTINFDLAKQRQRAVLISLRDVYGLTQQQIDEIYNTEVIVY